MVLTVGIYISSVKPPRDCKRVVFGQSKIWQSNQDLGSVGVMKLVHSLVVFRIGVLESHLSCYYNHIYKVEVFLSLMYFINKLSILVIHHLLFHFQLQDLCFVTMNLQGQPGQSKNRSQIEGIPWHRGLKDWKYCWWFRNPKQPPVGCNGINYRSLNWCRISAINGMDEPFCLTTWSNYKTPTIVLNDPLGHCWKPPVLDQSMLQQTNTAADTAKPKVFHRYMEKDRCFFKNPISREHVWHPEEHHDTVSKGGFLLLSDFVHPSTKILLNLHPICVSISFITYFVPWCPFLSLPFFQFSWHCQVVKWPWISFRYAFGQFCLIRIKRYPLFNRY